MKRKNMGNQAVIKAITLGLSAVMATAQPISVLAAEGEGGTPVVEPPVVETEGAEASVPAVVIPEAQDPVVDAQKALGNAVKEEAEAGKTAVFTFGAGIISEETLAIMNETKAANDLKEAQQAMQDGEKAVDEALGDMNSALKDSEAAVQAAEVAASDAQTQQQTAEDALAAANAATTSGAASTQAGIAGEAADKADEDVTEAEKQAALASEEYDKAAEEYAAAVKEAEEAVALANEKLANGAADADKALKDAQDALNRAQMLKNGTAFVDGIMAANEADKQAKKDAADQNLAAAQIKLQQAIVNEGNCVVAAAETGAALASADVMVGLWKVGDAAAKWNLKQKEQHLQDLIDAKAQAEADIKAAEEKVAQMKRNKDASDEELETAVKALNTAKQAVSDTEAEIEKLEDVVKDEQKNLEAANKALQELCDEEWEKAIVDAEKSLASANSKEVTEEYTSDMKNADIKIAEKALVGLVIKYQITKTEETPDIGDEGYYVVGTGAETKYYGYEINDAGLVEIFEYDRNVSYERKGETNTYSDEDSFKSAVAGKTEGVDYTVTKTEGSEAEYTVTIKTLTHKAGSTEKVKGSVINALGNKLPDGASFTAKSWLGITYTYHWDGNGWKCDADSTGYLTDDDNVTITYSEDVYATTINYNVVESQVPTGSGITKELTKEAVAPSWTVNSMYVIKNETVTTTEGLEGTEGLNWSVTGTTEAYDGTYTAKREYNEQVGTNTENKTLTVEQFKNLPEGSSVTYNGYVVYEENGKLKYKKNSTVKEVKKNDKVKITTPKYVPRTQTIQVSAKDVVDGKYTDSNGNVFDCTFNNDAKEATYTITYYTVDENVSYSKTDDKSDASQANISSQIAAQTGVVNGIDEKVKAAEQTISDLTYGTKNEDGTVKTKSLQTLKDEREAADKAVIAANAKVEMAKDNLAVAEANEKKLKDDYKAYYRDGIGFEIFGVDPASSYAKDLAKAGAEIAEAKALVAVTEKGLADAKAAQKRAAEKHEEALDNLEQATKELIAAGIEAGTAYAIDQKANAELEAAKKAHAASKAADEYMAQVVKEATEARDAAKAAKDAVDALKGSASVAADKLAEAEKVLAAAEARLAEAEKAVEDATDAAEKARAAYNEALDRVAALLVAEAAASAGEEEGEEEAPVYAILPGAGNVAIDLNALMANAPAPQAGRVAGVNRGDGAVEEIGENQVPLAGTIEEDDKATQGEKAVEISDKKVPLAGNIVNEEKTRNWWWLLLVALATAAGVGSYQYYNKQKKEELKVESDK